MSATSRKKNKAKIQAKKKELRRIKNLPKTLELPFQEIDSITVMLGEGIPGQPELLSSIPDEFKRYNNKWCKFANTLFCGGLDKKQFAQFRASAINPNVFNLQLRYLKAYLGSFALSHEQKESICGYLLSLMVRDVI